MSSSCIRARSWRRARPPRSPGWRRAAPSSPSRRRDRRHAVSRRGCSTTRTWSTRCPRPAACASCAPQQATPHPDDGILAGAAVGAGAAAVRGRLHGAAAPGGRSTAAGRGARARPAAGATGRRGRRRRARPGAAVRRLHRRRSRQLRRCAAARFSVCSGRTAPARPRPSACSAGCCRRPAARCRVAGVDLRMRARLGAPAHRLRGAEVLALRPALGDRRTWNSSPAPMGCAGRASATASTGRCGSSSSTPLGEPAERAAARRLQAAPGDGGGPAARAARSCFSTSRPAAPIRSRGASSGGGSRRSPSRASRSSSRRISWRRRSTATAS